MSRGRTERRAGVTLLELLLATAAAAVVIAAALAFWQTGLRSRQGGQEQAADLRRIGRLRERLRADLANALFTGGALVGRFVGASAERGSGGGGAPVLEFTTTGDRCPDGEVGSDVALVEYRLSGGELRRAVRRDLLATVWTEIEGTPWMDGIAAFEVEFHDGSGWVADWDAQNAGRLPRAAAVRIRWDDSAAFAARVPFELIVPIGSGAGGGEGG